MKIKFKYELILLILLSIAVLVVGCGTKEEEAKETANEPAETKEVATEEIKSNIAEDDYITFTLTEGWEINSRSDGSQIILEKTDSEEFLKPELEFRHSELFSPLSRIENWESVYDDGNRMDNVVIGGFEYLVFSRDATETGPYIYLGTSPGGELDENGEGYLIIEIKHTEIEDVAPMLETITFKPLQ